MLAGISAEYYLRLEVGRAQESVALRFLMRSRAPCGWTPRPRSICINWPPTHSRGDTSDLEAAGLRISRSDR